MRRAAETAIFIHAEPIPRNGYEVYTVGLRTAE